MAGKSPSVSTARICAHKSKKFFDLPTYTAAILFVLILCVPVLANDRSEFPVERPPFTPGIFPCSACHEGMEPDTNPRELGEHTNIRLKHSSEAIRWCFSCHDAKNRDKLRLVNGDLIDFTESYRLCGQCHGNIYRDWKAGVHGKRVGYFKGGQRTYYLCVNCHNPHDPKFKPLKPEPPPFRPQDTRNGP
jgi:hypothetical protein